MRVVIVGGHRDQQERVAAALSRDGFVLAGPDDPFDLVVTLGEAPHRLHAGGLMIDLATRRVARDGRTLRLTPREFDILAVLARAGRPLTRRDLLEHVWGYARDPGTNLVAVHVARLREKLGRAVIPWGREGYRLAGSDAPASLPSRGKLVGATGFEPATPRPPV